MIFAFSIISVILGLNVLINSKQTSVMCFYESKYLAWQYMHRVNKPKTASRWIFVPSTSIKNKSGYKNVNTYYSISNLNFSPNPYILMWALHRNYACLWNKHILSLSCNTLPLAENTSSSIPFLFKIVVNYVEYLSEHVINGYFYPQYHL